MTLFRPEVVEARAQRLQGSVVLTMPIATELMTLLLFVTIIIAGLWLATGSYARTETVRGVLVTNRASAKIVAPTTGQVSRLLVHEGSLVRAGAPLAVVDTDRRIGRGASVTGDALQTIEARLRLARAQSSIASGHDTNERHRLIAAATSDRAKITELSSQIALQETVVSSNQSLYDLLHTVQDRGFVSRVTYEQRRQNLASSRQQLAALREQRATVEGDLAETNAALADLPILLDRSVNDAQASIQLLKEQRMQLRSQQAITLVAPIDGLVTALQAGVGRPARVDVPLMDIVPEGATLSATLYAPSRAIGFVRPGQEVRLLYDAFPFERFGSFRGTVISVSRTAIDPRELEYSIKTDEPVYKMAVRLQTQDIVAFGQQMPLQPGMTLSANLILERRTFVEWLLSPLRTVLRRS